MNRLKLGSKASRHDVGEQWTPMTRPSTVDVLADVLARPRPSLMVVVVAAAIGATSRMSDEREATAGRIA